MYIGKRIRYLRGVRELSLSDYGKNFISTSHLSNIENGRFNPSYELLIDIANHFNLPSSFFTNYLIPNHPIEHLLGQLKEEIILDIFTAEKTIKKIENNYHEYLSNIYLEVLYLTLKVVYLYKTNQELFITNNILNYIESINEVKDKSGIPKIINETYLYYKGVSDYYQSKYKSSRKNFYLFLGLQTSIRIRADILYNISIINQKLQQNEAALLSAKKALKYYYSLHEWYKVASTHNLIGVLMWELNELEESFFFLKKAEELANTYKLEKLKGKVLHNMALVYKTLKDSKNALKYFNQALECKNDKELLITYRSIIGTYLEIKQPEEAEKIFNLAKKTIKTRGDYFKLFISFSDFFLLNMEEDEYIISLEEAVDYFSKSGEISFIKGLHEKIGDFYYKQKKYKLASHYYKNEILNNSKGGESI